MAKPPKIRHSKSRRDPVTIDLDASEVERVRDEQQVGASGEQMSEQPPPVEEPVWANASDEALAAEAAGSSADPIRPNAADESLASERADETLAAERADETAEQAEADAPAASRPADHESAEYRYGRAAPAGRSGMPALTGGLIGAVLALIGAGVLQWAGVLPAMRNGAGAVDAASLDVLRSEIAALKQEVAAGQGGGDDAALLQAVSESGSRIDALAGEMEQLRAGLEQARSQAGGADPAAVGALESRLTELEAAAASADESAAIEAVGRDVAALQAAQQSAAEAAAANAARLDALEQRLSGVTEQVEQQAEEPRMAMAVAATALKSAIDRGTPFMAELETYAAIAPDVPEIAALRDLAASGVPTRAQIEEAIPDAAARMIAAAAPVDENAGFFDRLRTSARSLVQVRPVGEVEGDSVEAKVARMEVALRDGNYAAAIEEFETLPEPVKAAGSEFIDKVRARLAADQLIAKALSGAAGGAASQ